MVSRNKMFPMQTTEEEAVAEFVEPRRYWSKVNVREADECWEWRAGGIAPGYGMFKIHGEMWLAHRVSWVLTYGPIPKGLCVLHRCDNRGCVNPYHLFLGTQADNMADAARKGRLMRKLTRENLVSIRKLLKAGHINREIARLFMVSDTLVSRIKSGKRYPFEEAGDV